MIPFLIVFSCVASVLSTCFLLPFVQGLKKKYRLRRETERKFKEEADLIADLRDMGEDFWRVDIPIMEKDGKVVVVVRHISEERLKYLSLASVVDEELLASLKEGQLMKVAHFQVDETSERPEISALAFESFDIENFQDNGVKH